MACIQEAFVPIMYIHTCTKGDTMVDIGALRLFSNSPKKTVYLLKGMPNYVQKAT